MNTRSIFDEDMSRPVIPVRPKPGAMALSEDALAKAMQEEASRNRFMRPVPWAGSTPMRDGLGPHGLPGSMQPDTLQARVWLFLVDHGPHTSEGIQAALGEDRWRVRECIQNLLRRGVAKRQKPNSKTALIEAVEME